MCTEDPLYIWIERVDSSVERAHAALLARNPDSLSNFTLEMEAASRERPGLTATPAAFPRLEALRGRLTLVRSLLRQAAAFIDARQQLETDRVLGYTPRGLERAL